MNAIVRMSGPAALSLVSLITIILLLFPRSHISPTEGEKEKEGPFFPGGSYDHERFFYWSSSSTEPDLPTDWMHVWRVVIFVVNLLALLACLAVLYVKRIADRIPRAKVPAILSASSHTTSTSLPPPTITTAPSTLTTTTATTAAITATTVTTSKASSPTPLTKVWRVQP